MTTSAIDTVPVGLECGIDMEYPVIAMFDNYHNPIYQAKIWGKNPSEQVSGIKPHKRIRHLALIPISISKVAYSDLVNIVYNSDNKIPIPWGCWNRYINDTYKVKDGYDTFYGVMKFKTINHVLSKDCKHTKDFPNDPACIDCVNRV